MYRLEMLHHQIGGRPSTLVELDEVEARVPLSDNSNVILGIGPQFFEPVENDVPMDPKDAQVASEMDKDEFNLDELPLNVRAPQHYQMLLWRAEHRASIPKVTYILALRTMLCLSVGWEYFYLYAFFYFIQFMYNFGLCFSFVAMFV